LYTSLLPHCPIVAISLKESVDAEQVVCHVLDEVGIASKAFLTDNDRFLTHWILPQSSEL